MDKINIFVSYSHEDNLWVQDGPNGLIPWLARSLQRDNVTLWYDPALNKLPGVEFKKTIKDEIDSSQFALLLLSQDFVNSEFIRDFELPWIKERVEKNQMSIIPILVGPVLWEHEDELKWLSERQMLPGKPTPLINYTGDEAKYKNVRVEILGAIKNRIRELRRPITDPTPPKPEADTSKSTPLPPKLKDRKKIFVISALLLLALVLILGVVIWAVRARITTPALSTNSNIEVQQETTSEPSESPRPVVMKNIKTKTITNAKDGSELILIPAGEFLMGSPQGEPGEGYNNERPQHKVYLSAYYIGKYEVTNAQYAAFVKASGYKYQGNWRNVDGKLPGYAQNYPNNPVVCVFWNDAKAYCDYYGLRLPTEAEWEKAARGTDGREYPWGNEKDESRCNWVGGPKFSGMANIFDGRGTLPVGSFFPSGASPYGCLDMAGNVEEWCSDWYGENYYSQSPRSNPQGPTGGEERVMRNCSWWAHSEEFYRCAYRGGCSMDGSSDSLGFRVARSR